MPRQIIDTESSRPAYVRRRVTQIVVTVILALAIAIVVFFAHNHHFGAIGIAPWPGNEVPGSGTTLVTLFPRSIHAA